MSQQQDERLGGVMMQYASDIERGMVTPGVSRVWRKAEAYREEMALRRAMRSLLVMRLLGGMYWMAMLAWYTNRCLKTPGGKVMMAMTSATRAMSGGDALAVELLMMAMAVGAGFLLYEGRGNALSTQR